MDKSLVILGPSMKPKRAKYRTNKSQKNPKNLDNLKNK